MSDARAPKRKLRVVFFGSQDNLGYRFAKWMRALGHTTEIYSFEPDLGRSQPELLDAALAGNYPEWFHVHRSPVRHFPQVSRAVRTRLARDFDAMVVSGTRGLLASRRVDLPKVLLALGGEVAEAPFPFAGRWQGPAAAAYRLTRWPFARSALRRMDRIIENYAVNLRCLDRLGLLDRRAALPIGEEIEANRSRINRPLLAKLTAQYARHHRVFLWLTRINYRDPDDAAYKGVDRFLRALETVKPDVEAGRVRLVMGTHGHDVAAFQAWARDLGFGPHIDWVPHLSYGDMLAYMALPNAVLFAKFGEDLNIFSGIDRDALSLGIAAVSAYDADLMTEVYGERPPYWHAVTESEIAAHMRRVVDISDDALAAQRRAMAAFGEARLDHRVVTERYVALIEDVLAARRRPA